MNEVTKAILNSSIGLAVFAAVTAGLIAVTQVATADKIQLERKKAQTRALREIVPDTYHDNDFLADAITLPSDTLLGPTNETQGYPSRLKGQTNGILLPFTAPDGYSGEIRLIAGINLNGEIIGVRVLGHQETPGLGDKIEVKKSDWIHQFNGKSLTNPVPDGWKVLKDGGQFDQMTGATITPRAVVKSIERTLRYFEKHKATLVATPKGGTTHEQ